MNLDLSDRVRALAIHLQGLDSGSGEAKLLHDAADVLDLRKAEVRNRLRWEDLSPEDCSLALYEIGGALRRHQKFGLANRADKIAQQLYPDEIKPLSIVPRSISG